MNDCLFCDAAMASKVLEDQYFYAVFDKFPVNPGHILIISKRHVPDLFGLDEVEFKNLYRIINQSKEMLDQKYRPDGYNVGVIVARLQDKRYLIFTCTLFQELEAM